MKIIAILEWDIKERQFAIVEYAMSKSALRKMRMRYKVLCARYPNNSFRLCEAELNVLAQNIVHSDALTAMRLAEEVGPVKETWRNSVRAAEVSHDTFCRALTAELSTVRTKLNLRVSKAVLGRPGAQTRTRRGA